MQRFKKLLIITLIFSLLCSSGIIAGARTPYSNYYISPSKMALPIPAPYECIAVLDFKEDDGSGTSPGKLTNPSDLYIDENDRLYIADTGGNRIVVLNSDYTFDFEIHSDVTYDDGDVSSLKEPQGVYVDKDGTILVADTGNSRLVEYTKYGNLRFSYPKPEDDVLSDDFKYQPTKVVKDARGYIYVVSSTDYRGILLLGSDGDFRSYYGANKVNLSLWESIARVLWDREERAGTIVNLPYTFNNIFASEDGYIYATTTTDTSYAQLRKINAAGNDVLYANYDFSDSTLLRTGENQVFSDVTVDDRNNMLLIDQAYGRIYEYDEYGDNIFVFGERGAGYGQTLLASSIEIDSRGRIYVLNSQNGTITIFESTDFADTVHEANQLYSLGKYDESAVLWNEVLDMNSYYIKALVSLGEIEMRKENYELAKEQFVEAQDAALTSEAFEEIRSKFIKDYFPVIMYVIVGLCIVYIVVSNIRRARRKKYGPPPVKENWLTPVKNFGHQTKYVTFHFVDGFEEIRYEGKGFYKDAFLIMLLYTISSVAAEYLTSFIYRFGEPLSFIDPVFIIGYALLPWIVVVIVNYGVTTIMYGEGRFRDVFIGGAYCHMPLVYTLIPMALLTHFLTMSEYSLFTLAQTIFMGYVVILVYFCIKGVHGFHPVKAFVVFFLTLVGVVAVVLLFMIVYGLASQMFGFIVQFGKELSYLV